MFQAKNEPAVPDLSTRQRHGKRFKRLWERRFADVTGTDPSALYAELAQLYSQPYRRYHTLDHIDHCLSQLDLASHQMNDPDAVEIALWFHDAIYVPEAKDNELKSAELFMDRLGRYVGPDFSQGVYNMILMTTHREIPAHLDEQFLVDIDLSSFGLPWELFKENGQRVRDELQMISDEDFYPAHLDFLQSLLDRPTFFYTDFFQACYETVARENIRRSMEELRLQGYRGHR